MLLFTSIFLRGPIKLQQKMTPGSCNVMMLQFLKCLTALPVIFLAIVKQLLSRFPILYLLAILTAVKL